MELTKSYSAEARKSARERRLHWQQFEATWLSSLDRLFNFTAPLPVPWAIREEEGFLPPSPP
jgi:hypothetical protein